MPPDDVNREWDTLVARYHAALRDHRAELRRLWARLEDAPAEREHLAELGAFAHQLAGSAGVFGYADLHDLAEALDRRIRTSLDGGVAPGAEAIRAQVEALAASLERSAARPPPSVPLT